MKQERLQPPPVSHLRMLDGASRACEENLDGGTLKWLKARGIDEQTARTFRLGVVPADAPPDLEGHVGWLSIPYVNALGVAEIRLRHLPSAGDLGERGKYWGRPGSVARLFNSRELVNPGARVLHIMEGELDAVAAAGALGWHTVACPGAQNWQTRHGILCRGFDEVFVWGDGDAAGREFNARVRETLRDAIPVVVSGGHDVSSLLIEDGADALEGLLAETRKVWGLS